MRVLRRSAENQSLHKYFFKDIFSNYYTISMPINVCIYIHDVRACAALNDISSALCDLNCKVAALGSPQCRGIENIQIIDNPDSLTDLMPKNNFQVCISDMKFDNKQAALVFIQYWMQQNEVYYNGKRHACTPSAISSLLVDIIKTRSFVPTGILYKKRNYLFLYDTDNMNPVMSTYIDMQQTKKTDKDKKIGLHWNFSNASTLRSKWLHLTHNLHIARDESDTTACNANVVINCSNIGTIDPRSIIYYCMEPHGEKTYNRYLSHINTQPLFVGTHERHLNNLEWHLRASLGQCMRGEDIVPSSQKMSDVLSVVVSDKDWDPGHKYRLQCIKIMDNMSDEERGFRLHIFGKCASLHFKNYHGELPEGEKDKALYPYKYHLNVENHSIKNYITEKFVDPMIAQCYTFYHGAPNIKTFFHPDTFYPLSGSMDENDIQRDIDAIRQCIQSDKYSQIQSALQTARHDILHKYSFEPRTLSILFMSRVRCVVWHKDTPTHSATADLLSSHLKAEGYKTIDKGAYPSHVDIAQPGVFDQLVLATAQKACKEYTSCYMQVSDTVHDLLYDRLCFAMSGSDVDVDVIRVNDVDMLITPQGAEKIIVNSMNKVPLFTSCTLSDVITLA